MSLVLAFSVLSQAAVARSDVYHSESCKLECATSSDNWLKEGRRPYPENRKFVSRSVDAHIRELQPKFKSENISLLFSNCLPNTLDTTVEYNASNNDTFVITGDIHAMWLRDSTNQVLPYMSFASGDAELRQMICGLVRRQAELVLIDPYSNAFNFNASGDGNQDDVSLRAGGKRVQWLERGNLFEQKYELDSLAAVLKLSRSYFEATGDGRCFLDDGFRDRWLSSLAIIMETIRTQQRSTAEEAANPADQASFSSPAYTFQRKTVQATDTQMQNGHGVPAQRCGMSKTYFRPSDDAVTLPFLVPANAMAVVELTRIAYVLGNLSSSLNHSSSFATMDGLSKRAIELATQIRAGIESEAIVNHPSFGTVFAYEVDGFGSNYKMDDANIPSLLSLPFLGYVDKADPLYRATRRLLLSSSNPFYFEGPSAAGIGGPHQGYGMVWPMSVIMRALTSDDDVEIQACLEMLVNMTGHSGFMHESVNMFDVSKFTRPWFAWANSLFGELILTLVKERPHLILKSASGPEII